MKTSKGTSGREQWLMPSAAVMLPLGSGKKREQRREGTLSVGYGTGSSSFFGSVFCMGMVFTDTSAEIQLCALAEVFNRTMFQNFLLKPQLNHQNSGIRLFALTFRLCLNTWHKSDLRGVTPHLTEAR